MTNEEVKEVLSHRTNLGYGIIIENESPQVIEEALKTVNKALEQQPSEDCVSREGARQFLYEEIDRLNNDELYDIFSKIIDDMYNELPPVTPTQKSNPTYLDCQKCENFRNPDYFKCKNCGKGGNNNAIH